MPLLENKATREWRESQENKAQDDANFVDEDSDSQDLLEIVRGLVRLRIMRARVEFASGRGWHVTDRMGREWAVDRQEEADLWTLDLGDTPVAERMRGIGWQRDIPRR